jgi:hypothetical protein
MSAIIDIKRPPTAAQVEELRKGLTGRNGIISLFNIGDRTQEGLARRGMGEWLSAGDMGERGTHSWFVITQLGRDYLAKLDGTTPVAKMAEEMTRDDVADGVRTALNYLGFGERRREAEKAPASEVLAGEFRRVRLVMRRAMRNNGAEAAHQALKQYNRTEALLIAARRFEQEDAATAAQEEDTMTETTQEPHNFRGLTREDVAQDAARALETLSAEDRATVEGKAPSVVLGLAFRRAQTAYCADRRTRTAEEEAAYERCANIASAAMIFERADDPEAAAIARADDFRITNAERAEEAKRREEARAWALEVEWRGAERHGKYLIRTEDRGHGIIAVYARGDESDMASIDRAANQYARQNLTFEDGLSAGAVTGGGEMFRGEWIAQQVYTTKRLAPRED